MECFFATERLTSSDHDPRSLRRRIAQSIFATLLPKETETFDDGSRVGFTPSYFAIEGS